jgi:hypothetical protein
MADSGRFAGDFKVDFKSICCETAAPNRLKIDIRRDHPFVAVGCIELKPAIPFNFYFRPFKSAANIACLHTPSSTGPDVHHAHRHARSPFYSRASRLSL